MGHFVKHTKRHLLGLAVVAATVALSATLIRAQSESVMRRKFAHVQVNSPRVEGEYVVKLRSGNSTLVRGLKESLLSTLHADVQTSTFNDRIATIKVEGYDDVETTLEKIAQDPNVEIVEPNYLYHMSDFTEAQRFAVTPNDPDFEKNWSLHNTGQPDSKNQQGVAGADVSATQAWDITKGSRNVVVAVIDTGVDYNHPDLQNNIYKNPNEIAGNGIDDDNNGLIDDVRGWDFANGDNDPMDDQSHGTHCAGSIGAEGGNGTGIAGVAWHVSIMPLKFLDARGSGSLAKAVDAINYATRMNVHVMSNSWGGGPFSKVMEDAIKAANERNIVFVAAAGNDGKDADRTPMYPASYDVANVISVAATDNRDQIARFSNYGLRRVHLGAPGVNIYSTVPMNMGAYKSYSGTSMACPHVAGAAAMLRTAFPTASSTSIKQKLLNGADRITSLQGKTITGGRLNVFRALSASDQPAPAPTPTPTPPPPVGNWKVVAEARESAHPYAHNTSERFQVSRAGAKKMKLQFARFELERNYDFVRLYDKNGVVVQSLTGDLGQFESVEVTGDAITVEFVTDRSVAKWGYLITGYAYQE